VLGRVCRQVRTGRSVGVMYIEHFLSDYRREYDW